MIRVSAQLVAACSAQALGRRSEALPEAAEVPRPAQWSAEHWARWAPLPRRPRPATMGTATTDTAPAAPATAGTAPTDPATTDLAIMGTAFTDPKTSDLTTTEPGTTELVTTDMVGSSTDLMRVGLRTPPVPIIERLRPGESFACRLSAEYARGA